MKILWRYLKQHVQVNEMFIYLFFSIKEVYIYYQYMGENVEGLEKRENILLMLAPQHECWSNEII